MLEIQIYSPGVLSRVRSSLVDLVEPVRNVSYREARTWILKRATATIGRDYIFATIEFSRVRII